MTTTLGGVIASESGCCGTAGAGVALTKSVGVSACAAVFPGYRSPSPNDRASDAALWIHPTAHYFGAAAPPSFRSMNVQC